MKKIKFAKNLIPLILSGEKTSTWRLFDDKNLQADDTVKFLDFEKQKVFAKAILTSVTEKRFKNLKKDDWKGHEKYKNKDEMYKIYSGYYKQPVNQDTKLKIIKFKLLN